MATRPAGRHGTGQKYRVVRAYLAELVDQLAVGDAIPSERALGERFDVSRMTVRQAIDALVADGLLERAQGRGTFVAPPPADLEMRLTTFGEEVRRRGMTPGSQVLEAATRPCPAAVADVLALRPGDDAHRVLRVRTADGEPWAVEDAWIPAGLAPDLLDDGVPESLDAELRRRGHVPTGGDETITAADATDTECRLLSMTGTHAVMRIERRTYAAQTPLIHSRFSYRGDRYSVFVPLGEARSPVPVWS
ncbi:GntR family transcriptional regulator [Isoptericola sp. AK164]|uniref:GntR family transcriptional regulator n=1 Tax=Isoptericola sp. AK164 TaxID=3024246 RepID=UPI0024187B49|nr:GntR family transcriptional regulator [Isoptericola sp. AK164]